MQIKVKTGLNEIRDVKPATGTDCVSSFNVF